ncbi:MAG: cytochrome d ubiquinol oxidase subunit II [Bacteroidales bacterium]|jgi:cytochrome d ubiquinol oxidase subunit II
MMELAVLFVGLSLLLYVLLGGADFGAGIIEIFSGKKGIDTISKAIAPVWEANHIWLIVVIVVMFNAFPEVYSTVSQYLHIPIMLVLFGIIFRGTAFTFRYYDPFKDRSHTVYTFLFKVFSVFTPFFLGVTLGAVISGKIATDTTLSFTELYVAPWLSWFSFSLGVFVVLLFAYLASVYLSGEPGDENSEKMFTGYSKKLLGLMVLAGLVVFLTAELEGLHLFKKYLNSWIGILCTSFATVLIPIFFYALNRKKKNFTRIIVGAQTTAILIGWFGIQFPVMVYLKNSSPLTVYNTIAPDKTLQMMILALLIGLALVIPLLLYLFKVFKFSGKKELEY